MDAEAVEILKEIRDEAKQTNSRLEQTNARLESLEGRIEFLERRTSKGFDDLSEQLERHVERLDNLTRRQTDSELRLATEVLSLANVTREVRDLLSDKLDDHAKVANHEERISRIEDRIGDRDDDSE